MPESGPFAFDPQVDVRQPRKPAALRPFVHRLTARLDPPTNGTLDTIHPRRTSPAWRRSARRWRRAHACHAVRHLAGMGHVERCRFRPDLHGTLRTGRGGRRSAGRSAGSTLRRSTGRRQTVAGTRTPAQLARRAARQCLRAACRQTASWITEPQSEDCMFLSIRTPTGAAAPKTRLPVILWIHGGGVTHDLRSTRHSAARRAPS